MSRVYNFSAGPSMLPESVLKRAAQELTEYGSSGQSVMEMSHRSGEYQAIFSETQALLREVMAVPDNYKILFLQGGAHLQFAMVPMNLSRKGKSDYVITGQWAKRAYGEAKKFTAPRLVASSEEKIYTYIPKLTSADFDSEADYLHICFNNTIYGTRFPYIPDTSAPIVADMSSCILSEPVDISKFGLIYAGAQKNMGPAGLTTVIIREDLIEEHPELPTMLSYKTYADNDSMYNTPPTYTIYVCGLVLKWLRDEIGGLENMKRLNFEKAELLYGCLDESDYFKPLVDKEDRSMMNITFATGDEQADKLFVEGAKQRGLINLKGHRSAGGMRASIYNAMPIQGVQALVDYMKEFERNMR